MSKLSGLTEKQSQVSQTLNLEELLGVSLRGNTNLRRAIAQAVIDHVVDRTEQGKRAKGGGFKPYSKEYKDSTPFAILKSPGDPINLTLTGRMLNSIDLLDETANTITYGISGTEAPKAYNHQVGDTVPERSFIGITKKEFDDIIEDNFADEVDELKNEPGRQSFRDIFQDVIQTQTVNELGRTSVFFNTLSDVLTFGELD